MFIRIFQLVGVLVFVAMLLAPFTFMKKESTQQVAQKEQAEKPTVKVEQPLHSVLLPDFGSIRDVKTKKRKFFNFIAPAVIAENQRIELIRAQLTSLEAALKQHGQLNDSQRQDVLTLSDDYGVNVNQGLDSQISQLLVKVDIIPMELILAQAANESAWGTSRFARIGLNFFGIWCYRPNCGMVPNGRINGAKHEVAKFDSVEANVRHYLKNINTHGSYQVFRIIRAQLREEQHSLDAQILASGLLKYSERGGDYVIEITNMIRHNQKYFDEILNEKV